MTTPTVTQFFPLSNPPHRSGVYRIKHKIYGKLFWAYYDAILKMWGCYASRYADVDLMATKFGVLNRYGVFEWQGTVPDGACLHCGEQSGAHTFMDHCIKDIHNPDVMQRKILGTKYQAA